MDHNNFTQKSLTEKVSFPLPGATHAPLSYAQVSFTISNLFNCSYCSIIPMLECFEKNTTKDFAKQIVKNNQIVLGHAISL